MTQGNPYPSAKHHSEDWDPAGKSEQEKRAIDESLKKGQPSKPGTDEPSRPKDSDPSDMTDFEKNTTTEELKKDQSSPG
jgi:hypothetical protein